MSVVLLPPGADALASTAAGLLRDHASSRPDFTHLWVLTPGPSAAPFRVALARAAGGALLGPQVTTLKDFARSRGTAEPPLTALDCRLRLVEALRRHRPLYPDQDPWRIADALFELFEEMTAAGCRLPASEDEFTQRLAQAYGTRPLAALSLEARRIHLLWRAFQEDTGGRTPAGVYAVALRGALTSLGPESAIVAGYDHFSAIEAAALAEALPAGRVRVVLRGRSAGRDGEALVSLWRQLGAGPPTANAGGDPRSAALDAVFDAGEAPLAARAAALRGQPAALTAIRITEAAGAEHEARCVELAVRRAWLAGARNIAIVAPDRRLARRVRALLERAGLPLRDFGGWALSTSRAAASLAAWLDCLERDFDYRPLLDLLKSGFIDAATAQAVEHLEQHIVYHHRIESGLRRYLAHASGDVAALLKALATAARRLPSQRASLAPAEWAGALIGSLQSLKLWHGWQADLAGRALMDELTALAATGDAPQPRCTWTEFRELADRSLERATFIPEGGGPIRLLTLDQTAALAGDAVILAGASRDALPGAPPGDPFFNDAVRGELGLPTWREHRALALARFRQLLEAAPHVHLVYSRAEATEPALPSPWIEALETFASAAGLPSLRDTRLADDAGNAAVEVAAASTPPGPLPMPAPKAPPGLVPQRLSASAHQSLIDCPYKFFARYMLRLKDPEAPDDEADAREYGKRVHRILHAFHQRDEDLPAPFAGAVTPQNIEQARAKLAELADAVFEPDVERRIVTVAWRERFRKLIPTLTEWLAERSRDWPAVSGEVELERALGGGVIVDGRVDRLERTAAGGECVVDYKTGVTPPEDAVHAGETVQLPHYALLCERPERVEYWTLKDKGKRVVVEGPALVELAGAVQARLLEALRAVSAGAPLAAHGDESVCQHCDYIGVCRKGTWS